MKKRNREEGRAGRIRGFRREREKELINVSRKEKKMP